MSAQPLARAFRQIGGMTAVSRMLGFVRDIVFAALLGAGPVADAFLVALKLPNMFRRLTAEGALSNAFVPAFARARREDGEAAAVALAGETQATLTMVLVALVILGEIFMPAVIGLLAPGFADTPDRMNAAITLACVTFPYLPMISLVAFWAAIANADGRFMTRDSEMCALDDPIDRKHTSLARLRCDDFIIFNIIFKNLTNTQC